VAMHLKNSQKWLLCSTNAVPGQTLFQPRHASVLKTASRRAAAI